MHRRDFLRHGAAALVTASLPARAFGIIVQDGSGNAVLVLSGANTYTGATTINAGTLLVSGSTALSGAVNRAIPDALRGVVFSTISSLLLLAFRGTSIGLRAELGGTLFMGLVTLSVYGLSAGFGTGLVGALVAIPGLALAAVLIHEFTHMVLKVTAAAGAPAAAPPPRGALPGSPGRLLTSLEQWAHPTRSRALMVAFAAVPLFVVVASVGAAFTNGGWLFWSAQY